MTNLTGQHAVITGGGTGIGLAIARRLAAEGAAVTLMSRNEERLAAAAAEIPGARAVPVDVTDENSVKLSFAAAANEGPGPVTILVNNAGGTETGTLAKTSLESWQQNIDLNLTGCFLCIRAVLPAMTEANAGRIINIASTAGLNARAKPGRAGRVWLKKHKGRGPCPAGGGQASAPARKWALTWSHICA